MRAGQLRQRIEIQEPTAAKSVSGAETITYVTRYTRYAEVKGLRGREALTAIENEANVDYKINLRYDPALANVTPKWRVALGAINIDLVSWVNVDERNIKIEAMGNRII